jgi:hypothetical protein
VTRSRLIVGAAIAGLVVLTLILFLESLNIAGTAQIVGYQTTADPRRIVVIVALGRLDDIAERQIQEDATSVRVTVRKRTTSGTAPSDLIVFPVTLTLRDALRDRTVLDEKGAPVPDRGMYLPPQPSPR